MTFSAISNVLGGINPVSDIVKAIRAVAKEAIIVIDAAQAVGHIPVDVSAWDADFVAFSGHKMYGPTGIGILFGKHDLLESLTPTVFGGGMVADSCGDPIVYRESPVRFEAGTPNIEGVFGLGAAIEFLQKTGINQIREHDIELSRYAMEKLQETFGTSIHILGPKDPAKRGGLISFVLEGVHPHDLAHLLGEKQICIRAGEHCAAPLHRALHIPASARISFGIYNSKEDIDQFVDEMKSIQAVLGGLRPR